MDDPTTATTGGTDGSALPGRGTRVPSRTGFEADLIRQVLAGTYPPGSKLPSERLLAASSGLSRPIVREVLRSLVERGLIDVLPARGAYVRAPGSTPLAQMMGSAALHHRATPRDLVEARVLLEGRSARAAAAHASAADVALLRDLATAFDRAPSTIERARLDLALHTCLARLSGNPVLTIMFGAITPLVLDLQLRSVADPEVLRVGAPLHHVVVDAVAAGDGAAAEAAMVQHVVLALDLYGDDVDVPLQVLAEDRLAAILGGRPRLEDVIEDALLSARAG